jgi:hypothetical protein
MIFFQRIGSTTGLPAVFGKLAEKQGDAKEQNCPDHHGCCDIVAVAFQPVVETPDTSGQHHFQWPRAPGRGKMGEKGGTDRFVVLFHLRASSVVGFSRA